MTAKHVQVLMRLGAIPKVRARLYAGMTVISIRMPSGKEVLMNLAVAHALGRKLAKAAMEATAEERRRKQAAKRNTPPPRPASAAPSPAAPPSAAAPRDG